MSRAALVRGWEVVIGIETHTQLSTASKIFSGSSTTVSPIWNQRSWNISSPATTSTRKRCAAKARRMTRKDAPTNVCTVSAPSSTLSARREASV